MSENENQGPTGGPAIIQADAVQAIDILSGQLLKRAKENGGGLTAPDIRAVIETFKNDSDAMLEESFNEAWQQCLASAESAHWTTARKFHFERIMVKVSPIYCLETTKPSRQAVISLDVLSPVSSMHCSK